MAPPKDPKKKIAECQKAIHGEVKKLSLSMRKSCDVIEKLVKEKEKVEEVGTIGPEEKKALKKIDLSMAAVQKVLLKNQKACEDAVTKILQPLTKGDEKEVSAFEKGLGGAFVKELKDKTSLSLGKNVKMSLGFDFKKLKKLKKFKIESAMEVPKLKVKGSF